MDNKEINCCSSNELSLTPYEYWDKQYKEQATGWDIGHVSTPIKTYIDNLKVKGKTDLRILIPGCGNSYEAEYLLEQGFTNITLIDIAPTLVNKLKQKFEGNKNISIVLGDFFLHKGVYDIILEQTFFCAIDPTRRKAYVNKTHVLLAEKGKIVGILFNKVFEKQGPPHGGTIEEYQSLFHKKYELAIFEDCYNSINPRKGTEMFIELIKK